MDSPFFTYHWNSPSRARGIPVQQKATPARKVVSIPVRFVGSERNRSDSALKIQKVFRGFLVRKSVRKIAVIRREVDEIDRKMSEKATMESIRSDPKERLRVNETLMSLLFRLDSVRGVDSGVRDCRKAVIKRAIALQELVDAIASGERNVAHVDETLESEAVPPNQEPSRMDDDDLGRQASEIESSAGNLDDNSCNLSVDRETLELENEVGDSVPNPGNSGRSNFAESIPDSRRATIEPDGTHKLKVPGKACEESERVSLGGVDAADEETEFKDGEMDYDLGPNSVESERTRVAGSALEVDPDEPIKLQALEQACKKSEESENVDLDGVDAPGPEMEVNDGEMDDDWVPNSVEPETTHVSESMPNGEPDQTLKLLALEQICENSEKVGGVDAAGNEMAEAKGEELVEDHEVAPSANECTEESVGTSQTLSGSYADPDSLDEVVEENSCQQEEKLKIDNKYGIVEEERGGPGGREESKRSSELLERIMEDNERMMGLMAELFVRNEMQTRLLNSLSQRVGQMERAFICEKLRRKKKRLAAGVVDDVENSKDTRNCGKR